MAGSKPQANRKGRCSGRPLLIFALLICIAGAAVLGYQGITEWMDRKRGDDFYAQMAADVVPADRAVAPIAEADGSRADFSHPVPAETTEIDAVSDVAEAPPAPQKSEIDFDALRQSCPDIVGWIQLADSAIDYPIVLGEDNDFYLTHLPDKTSNQAGSIMMDRANAGDFSEAITILHGHHMKNGSMFGRLEDYRNAEYYQSHPVIRLYTPAGDYDVQVFAAYSVDGYAFGYPTFFEDRNAFDLFIRRALSATPYEADVDVEYGDHLLMLSTCAYGYKGERFVVLGKIAGSARFQQLPCRI